MSKNSTRLEKGTFKFRPKARLLNLLGFELITDEVIAAIELVKNSYDADAQKVGVTISNVSDKKNGVIKIKDDGHGMTLKILQEAWMEPARDNKKGIDGKRTRRFGRLPLGEKGVGRFSADKLGLRLEIISRFCKFNSETKEAINLSQEEVVMVVEGKKFVEDAYLDEIECAWQTRSPEEFTRDSHGTLLQISELRKEWNRELVEKVHRGLARLASPLAEAQDFELWFESNEFPEFSGKIENPLLKNAPHSLEGTIDENGIMTYTLVVDNGEPKLGKKDLRKELGRFHIKKGEDIEFRKPACGPFRFRLYAFERNRAVKKKYGMDKEKVDLLNSLCGVSIYRDNFRVLPYGEPGNDWLYLDKGRIQSPGKVLGNDRVIGYVEISQSSNPQLRDKTNREGLIEEGLVFADLRDLVREATDFLGLERYLLQPHEKRSKEKVEKGKDEIEEGTRVVQQSSTSLKSTLDKAKNDIEERRFLEAKTAVDQASLVIEAGEEAIKQIDDGKSKLLEELIVSEQQINNLIALSGIGLTAERMTHEFSRAVRLAMDQLQKSLAILNRERKYPEATEHIYSAITQLMIVRTGLQQMEPLYYSKRRYSELLNVAEIAKQTQFFYSNDIKDLDVEVTIIPEEKLLIEMGKGHLMQIFDNLFDNALYWLKFKPAKDGRKITIKISGKEKTIIFADNGPGIEENIKNHLFDPFVSTKPDGRGLGLFIIQDILQNYKSEIEILTDNKLLEGANFKITFLEK
jgi:signal transduction histidine kinase